ncbi:MAG: amidohydrolase [Anaerolineae bacterium]|nr:MAG: amidohydrolase [Anaerolineae bacterium]WKZ43730.1 MAG: amidohydrolase [Anaerolineales bacterium]
MILLHNARIITQNPAQPTASALLIDRERILAVGDVNTLFNHYPRAKGQNLGGRVIVPGLTDAHLHLKQYGLGLQKIDCEVDTKEECLRRVAERVKTAKPGEWILGHGWNQNEWSPSPAGRGARGEGESPTSAWPNALELDSIAPNNPVYLTAKSLHAAWANTNALKLANITASTPDPQNGQIQRDAHGVATGILLETAMELVSRVLPEPTSAEITDAIEKAQPILWKMGLTGIHDFDRRDSFMALQKLHAEHKLKLRVLKNLPVELLDEIHALGLRGAFGDDMLRIGNVKAFMDGALGPHTAAMFQPYVGEENNRGILNMDGEELFEHGRKAAQVGLGMTVHAIGDRANHEVLNAYEQLRNYEKENHLPALRHRIEHVQVIHPDDAPRLAQLNVVASMQPIHATSDMFMADQFWGERAKLSYAWKTQLDFGARLAFGSDAPVESPNPFWGLHAAITRRRADGSPSLDGWRAEQKVSAADAFAGYTLGAAYAATMEDRLGKLAPGFLADLIVLEKDPFTCNADELLALESSATMVNGEWVYMSF